jgi:antitoxin SocA-like protein
MRPNKRKQMKADEDKFRELILFVAERCEGDPTFGATKLNKLLFNIDFLAYLLLGKSVTGQRYQKLENGPAPRALVPVTRHMVDEGDLAFREGEYHGYKQKRAIALREPDVAVFSGPEVQLCIDVVDELWGKSAAEVSEMSHRFIGWKLAEFGEDIPYEAALVGGQEPSEEARRQGVKLESMAKECLERDEA